MTAVLSSLIGVATSVWQVAILRAGAWTAPGLRVPARNALLADIVPPSVYGRAYGFERAMDNLGPIIGPLLGILLVTLTSIRGAILISVIPGLLAGVAIFYAIRHTPQPETSRASTNPAAHPVGPQRSDANADGRDRRVRAREHGQHTADPPGDRAAYPGTRQDRRGATCARPLHRVQHRRDLISIPAGALGDRHGSPRILLAGAAAFLASYVILAVTGPSVPLLAVGFVLAGIALGCGETAETTAIALVAPNDLRGSAFGLLAATQSVGNLVASVTAGILWTAVSPAAAFLFAAGATLLALAAFAPGALAHHSPSESTGP